MGSKIGDADAAAGFFFIGDIDPTGGVIPHPQHGQARGTPRLGHPLSHNPLKPLLQSSSQLTTVETLSHGEGQAISSQHATAGLAWGPVMPPP